MMTWTLYILLLTSSGEWQALEGRTFTKPGVCQRTAAAMTGRPVSGGVIIHSVCKETIET